MSGTRNDAPYGPSPTGHLIYTREGSMSATITHGARKPLSVTDRSSPCRFASPSRWSMSLAFW
jgi:hypothetical protein